jgi:hypothetical protein
MNPIRSFVVRIYRQDRRSIAGLVEDVRTGKSTFFQSFAGLWDALTTRARGAPRQDASSASASGSSTPSAGGTSP